MRPTPAAGATYAVCRQLAIVGPVDAITVLDTMLKRPGAHAVARDALRST